MKNVSRGCGRDGARVASSARAVHRTAGEIAGRRGRRLPTTSRPPLAAFNKIQFYERRTTTWTCARCSSTITNRYPLNNLF